MTPGLSGEIEAARAAGAALRERAGEVASYDLRLGRYQDVLADVEVDAVICDPPYSERTHDGYRSGSDSSDAYGRAQVNYGAWDEGDVTAFVEFWHERTRGWIVALTDSELFAAWRSAFAAVGRMTFQPVPCVTPGMTCRLNGDGPSSWAVYAVVARPRVAPYAKWGTTPGAYITPQADGEVQGWGLGAYRGGGGGRGKPIGLMRKIVSDYSRPGDLVCDPTAGYGSTLAASLQKGRRAIGAECEADVYAEARRRLDLVMAGPADLFDPRSARQEGLGL